MGNIFLLSSLLILGLMGMVVVVMFTYRERLHRASQEERLQRFRAICEAQEAERERIARELHDGVAQTLALAKRNVWRLPVAEGPEPSDEVEQLNQLLEESIEGIRQAAHDLMPAVLKTLGLEPALRDYIQRLTTDAGPQIDLDIESNDLSWPSDFTALNLFRMIQELIGNSIRHGQARSITVRLNINARGGTLHYADDGVGFDASRQASGLGMHNLNARAILMKGTHRLESLPDQGMQFHFSWKEEGGKS